MTQCHQSVLQTSSRNEIITDTKTNGTPLCVERMREGGNVCTMRGREMRQKVETRRYEKERESESKRRRKEDKEEEGEVEEGEGEKEEK